MHYSRIQNYAHLYWRAHANIKSQTQPKMCIDSEQPIIFVFKNSLNKTQQEKFQKRNDPFLCLRNAIFGIPHLKNKSEMHMCL